MALSDDDVEKQVFTTFDSHAGRVVSPMQADITAAEMAHWSDFSDDESVLVPETPFIDFCPTPSIGVLVAETELSQQMQFSNITAVEMTHWSNFSDDESVLVPETPFIDFCPTPSIGVLVAETELSQQMIAHMMAFIEQEANEKVEEIEAKAEEEFNIEKGKLVTEQRLKIIEYYEKKEKQVELQKKIQSSNMLNQARLRVLKAREDHIRNVLEDARNQLQFKTRDSNQYKEVVKNLILQGLYQQVEEDVTVRCRQQDVAMIESSLGSIATQYSKDVGMNCKVTVDKDIYLPPDCAGGIELYSQKGKIKISNTLESRLEMISQQLLPEIREALFGTNVNRKFKD